MIMTKEQLGSLIIASEDTMYHVAKTLLRSDADCTDAIQEAIVKAFAGRRATVYVFKFRYVRRRIRI